MTLELMRRCTAVPRPGAGSERKEQTGVFKYACSRFAKLPVELVESILASLDTPDLLSGKLVCRAWRDLIHSSLQLQHKVECFIASVSDGHHVSGINLLERTRRVKRWRNAWKTLRWSQKYDATYPCPWLGDRTFHVQGCVLGDFNTNASGTFEFYRIGSEARHVDSKQWAVAGILGSLSYGSWTFSPEADLLAVLRIHQNTRMVDVCFYSCTTGRPHPEASMASIPLTLHAPAVVDDSWEIELTVCDDLVGIFVYDDNEGRTEVWVYNWEEGKLVFSVFSESDKDKLLPDHFGFLSRDVVLFTAFGHDTNALIAVDIRQPITPGSRFQDLPIISNCVSLDLPKLTDGTVYQLSTIACTSMRSRICGQGIFGSRHANTLIVLMLELADQQGAEYSYDLVMSPTFIISRLEDILRYGAGPWPSSPTRQRMLTWRDWSKHTRVFRTLNVPEVPVHGSRYLTARALPDGRYRLVLRDFDTLPALRLDIAAGDADVHMGSEALEDEDKLWDQEAWVGAPYREVESDIVVEDEDRVFLAEDGIVVARHRDYLENVDSTKLEIYSI